MSWQRKDCSRGGLAFTVVGDWVSRETYEEKNLVKFRLLGLYNVEMSCGCGLENRDNQQRGTDSAHPL